jgi:hypothetical protein
MIEPPSCPLCLTRVRASDLRRELNRRTNLLSERVARGVACPGCGAVLHIVRWPAVVIRLALFPGVILACALALKSIAPQLAKGGQLFLVFLITAATYAAGAYWGPLFAQLRPAGPDERLIPSRSFEEEEAALLPNDPQYQEAVEDAEQLGQWQEEIRDPARKPWKCPSCGEENPAEFDECWKCEKDRPES